MKLSIIVKPGAKKNELQFLSDGRLKLKISAQPIDGKANEAVILFFSQYLDISKSSIKIIRGHHSSHKVLEIEGDTSLILNKITDQLKLG